MQDARPVHLVAQQAVSLRVGVEVVLLAGGLQCERFRGVVGDGDMELRWAGLLAQIRRSSIRGRANDGDLRLRPRRPGQTLHSLESTFAHARPMAM
jgi:hypothetical protein